MRQLSPNLRPPREAPAPSPFRPHAPPPGHDSEPVLDVANIQGNIIGGFNKDYQTFLFLRVRQDGDAAQNLAHFKTWLADFVPSVATAEEVLGFNRLFKRIRSRRKQDSRTIQSTWINVAFSFNLLQRLKPDATSIADVAFKQGLAARAVASLGDPADPKAEGNPQNWLFGGKGREADLVIIVGSDDPTDLDATIEQIETNIYDGRGPGGQLAPSALEVIYKQQGATLPPPLTGHEHFGFLDGVSQPGIRGLVSSVTREVLTPRQNPNDADQGKPGQDLLWPGEFVFGYPGQDPDKDVADPSKDPVHAGVDWAKNGSFLVIRRLRQDVPGFHGFLASVAQQNGVSADLIGARLVGRWKSGAPVMRSPDQDLPALAEDECANNHFEFQKATAPIPSNGSGVCADNVFPQSPGDKTGAICPFAAHIRKTYPRDDTGTLAPQIGEKTTQTHRLLRRGIPFGPPFIPAKDPSKNLDDGNRGLMFAAYQTSIVEQFEFVQSAWANNAEFKDRSVGGKLVSGHDLIIGQSNQNGSRERRCVIQVNGQSKEVVAQQDWVIPTGGGYFFAPSIDAMKQMATG